MTRDHLRGATALGVLAVGVALVATPLTTPMSRALAATALPQFADALAPGRDAKPQCSVVVPEDRFTRPLPRMARRIAAGRPARIVAIGSSSTAGAGASSPEASYPSRLEAELNRHFPGEEFSVLNRGVNGEEARDMLARLRHQRHIRAARSRDLAGRHQLGVARPAARSQGHGVSPGSGAAQGDPHRRRDARSAICPQR